MKETQPHKADEIAIVKQVEQKKQRAHVGTLKPHSGHTLFEYNKVTKELRKATFDTTAVDFKDASNGLHSAKSKVNVKENCFYLSSLNEKNAVKKIHRLFRGAYVIAINE